MKIEFSLDLKDHLEHQLYIVSKNTRLKKQNRNSWFLISSSITILGLITYIFSGLDKSISYGFFMAALIMIIFYPFLLKKKILNDYTMSIVETYQYRFGKPITLNFEEEYIIIKNIDVESKINYTAFQELIEIKEYYFMKSKTGGNIIIPKNKFGNLELFHKDINVIANKFSWKKNVELDWKWK